MRQTAQDTTRFELVAKDFDSGSGALDAYYSFGGLGNTYWTCASLVETSLHQLSDSEI